MVMQSRPVYLKLRDQIAAAIIDGTYAEGQLLPSVRAFAAAEGANPLTVAKAYQQFRDEGLVQIQRGVGMVLVPGAAETLLNRERDAFLRNEWPQIAERLRQLRIDHGGLRINLEQA
ncbi:GntR family transcriptional regulator [Novosphingobium sp. Chol11]|uniref:GntR family transcriptional regulator n=1 Tax=Novosphingobium sp. Chol11 TaxID=1385763 RepID=UPI0025EAF366|nr:GntR family transcriptional regulator [Novosphingobium sp. Chol11]